MKKMEDTRTASDTPLTTPGSATYYRSIAFSVPLHRIAQRVSPSASTNDRKQSSSKYNNSPCASSAAFCTSAKSRLRFLTTSSKASLSLATCWSVVSALRILRVECAIWPSAVTRSGFYRRASAKSCQHSLMHHRRARRRWMV